MSSQPKILSENEIRVRMRELPGWTYKNNKLSKEFEFRSFMDTVEFVRYLAPFFEKIDHHADMHISYTKILFELQRFDAGEKVTDLDFEAAKEIEKRFTEVRID